MATWPGWEQDVLAALGAPPSRQNIQFLDAWQRQEGGGARYNPLNTTLRAGGASAYNSAGVRNYPSAVAGAQATAATLQSNSAYAGIVQGLRAGSVERSDTEAVLAGLSTWVSGSRTGGTDYARKVYAGGTGNVADLVRGLDLGDPLQRKLAGQLPGVTLEGPPGPLAWLQSNLLRFAMLGGGFVLLLAGLYLLGSGSTPRQATARLWGAG